jgi:hypothetical protein
MNDVSTGLKTFNCSTDYDYYIIYNREMYETTHVNDVHGIEYDIIIDQPFIPNHSMSMIFKYMDTDNVYGIFNDQYTYEPRRSWMSSNKNDLYKYPCVYTISKDNRISYKWSSLKKEHFGKCKFILSNGSGYIKDPDGLYGLTQWAYAIYCNSDELDTIEKVIHSRLFKTLVDATKLTYNKYNYSILRHLKQGWYKDFGIE